MTNVLTIVFIVIIINILICVSISHCSSCGIDSLESIGRRRTKGR